MTDNHTLDIGTFGSYGQIFDDLQEHVSSLPDIHNLDIGTFGPYAQISDEC